MPINPYMKAKRVQPVQTYVDQYVPLPFKEMQAAADRKQLQYDQTQGALNTTLSGLSGQGYTGDENKQYSEWAKKKELEISNFIEGNPDLAKNSKAAQKLMRDIAKEKQFGYPALLARRGEEYEKHRKSISENANEWSDAKRLKAASFIDMNKAGVGFGEDGYLKELHDPSTIHKSINASERIQSYGKDIKDDYISNDELRRLGALPLVAYTQKKGVLQPRAEAIVLKRALNDEELKDDAIAEIQKDRFLKSNNPEDWFYNPDIKEIQDKLMENIEATRDAVTREERKTQLRTLNEMGMGKSSESYAPAGNASKINQFNIQADPGMTTFDQMNSARNSAQNTLTQFKENPSSVRPSEVTKAKLTIATLDSRKQYVREKLEKDPKFDLMFNKFLNTDLPKAIGDSDPNLTVAVKSKKGEELRAALLEEVVKGADNGSIVRNPETGSFEFTPEFRKRSTSAFERIFGIADVQDVMQDNWVDAISDVAETYLSELDELGSEQGRRYSFDIKNSQVKKNSATYNTLNNLIGINNENIKSKLLNGSFSAYDPVTGLNVDKDNNVKTLAQNYDVRFEDISPIHVGGKPGFELSYRIGEEGATEKLFVQSREGFADNTLTPQIRESLILDYNNAITEMGDIQSDKNKNFIYAYGSPNIDSYDKIKNNGPAIPIKITPVEAASTRGGALPSRYGMPKKGAKPVVYNVVKDNGNYYLLDKNNKRVNFSRNGQVQTINDPVKFDIAVQQFIANQK